MRSIARLLSLLWRTFVVVSLLTVGLFAFFLWEFNRPIELPTPSGVFGVGRATYSGLKATRLRLVVWYPIDKKAATNRAPYNPIVGGRLLDGQPDFMEQNLARVQSHAVTGKAISNAASNYPVVVLWPGYGWQPSRYAILAEELASDGFIVAGVAPDYSFGSLADTISARQLVEHWAGQMISVVTILQGIDVDTSQPLAGHVNTSRVGFFGHSTGGAVSIQACSLYPQCVGAIDLDGSVFGSVVAQGTSKPLLFIMGEAYRPLSLPGMRRSRNTFDSSAARDARTIGSILARSPNAERVIVRGFRHAFFTDEAMFFQPFSGLARALGGQADAREGIRSVISRVIEFFSPKLYCNDTVPSNRAVNGCAGSASLHALGFERLGAPVAPGAVRTKRMPTRGTITGSVVPRAACAASSIALRGAVSSRPSGSAATAGSWNATSRGSTRCVVFARGTIAAPHIISASSTWAARSFASATS